MQRYHPTLAHMAELSDLMDRRAEALEKLLAGVYDNATFVALMDEYREEEQVIEAKYAKGHTLNV